MKTLLIFLLILSIIVAGCSQGTDYKPQQPQQQIVGNGCNVAQSDNNDFVKLINTEIKSEV